MLNVILKFAIDARTSVIVCGLFVAVLWRLENQAATLPFAVTILLTVAAILFLLTRRFSFSLYAACSVIGTISLVSLVKYKTKGFDLHFYDFVFFGGDPETYTFLFTTFSAFVLPGLLLLALIVSAVVVAYRLDRPRAISSRNRMVAAMVGVLLLPVTYPAEASGDHRYFYYLSGRHVSSFFVSLMDMEYLFSPTPVLKRLAAMPPQTPLSPEAICPQAGSPDVFIVLQESHTNLGFFPQLEDHDATRLQFGENGTPVGSLMVETFGGGTWVSNLAVMAGLSATDFGWRSPYLTLELEHKVSGALPQIMRDCGYRTAAVIPMRESFVNEGPFLRSIGFDEIIDADDVGATDFVTRDDVFYAAAERFIEEHHETDGRPLFLLVETMFPHSPYSEPLEPQIEVGFETGDLDPELSEYLRRIAISRMDYEAFLKERRADAKVHPSVLLEYGDHQSYATKPMVDSLAGEDSLSDLRSLAYRTYYKIETFGWSLASDTAETDLLDIGFLGAYFVEKTGLPTSSIIRDLNRLRVACDGNFHACADREAIDQHLRRRIDAGALEILEEEAIGPTG